MEVLLILFILFVIAFSPVIIVIALVTKLKKPSITKTKLAELKVNEALRNLDMKLYVLFENVILPSAGNTAHTEVDHIVVSPFGVFCIETKSHNGSIYAYEKNKNWAQYLGGQKFTFHSPYRQNYKHVKAIEALIGKGLKAPVHSYIVFPNAQKVVTDSKCVYDDVDRLVERISNHKRAVYNLEECTYILKLLAYASSKSDSLSSLHIEEIQSYLSRSSS